MGKNPTLLRDTRVVPFEGFFLFFYFFSYTKWNYYLIIKFHRPTDSRNFGERRAVWYDKYDITKE